MMPDLLHLDAALFALALVIAFGAVMLSRYLWNRVGRANGRKAQMYSPREFLTDLRKSYED